jgi:TolA-binding protein
MEGAHMAASIDLTYAPALRLIESGDLAGAAQILGKILNSRPQDGQSRYLLGMCYLHMRNFFAAESHFRALVKGSPSHYRAIYNLGLSLEGQGRRQEAARVYQHVLALRPDFSKARTRLATFCECLVAGVAGCMGVAGCDKNPP